MDVLILLPIVLWRCGKSWFGFLSLLKCHSSKERGSDSTPMFWPTACDCNGRSQECYFDPELYRSTGHGGHCTNCQGNTDGANCERCRENFFRLVSHEACSPCHCSPVGKSSSISLMDWKTNRSTPCLPWKKALLPGHLHRWSMELCTLL